MTTIATNAPSISTITTNDSMIAIIQFKDFLMLLPSMQNTAAAPWPASKLGVSEFLDYAQQSIWAMAYTGKRMGDLSIYRQDARMVVSVLSSSAFNAD